MGCFFNATWSHFPCHVPSEEKMVQQNLFGKINWGPTSSQNTFALFHGENIKGSCKALIFLEVAQWMNGHIIFHFFIFHVYIFIHYTSTFMYQSNFHPLHYATFIENYSTICATLQNILCISHILIVCGNFKISNESTFLKEEIHEQ